MTKKQVLEWNEECRKIVRNPEIIALKSQDYKIASLAQKRRNKIQTQIQKLQAECQHVYNFNLSNSCLKCGLFDDNE